MKSTRKIAGFIAATAAAAMLVTASASAEDRHRDGTWRDNNSYRDNGGNRRDSNNGRYESRNNNRFSDRGRVQRFEHERDGYRVWIGGARYPYWIPASRLGRHRLSVGIDLRLGGIFNGTYVDVDALGWPGDPYYNDPYYNDGGYYGGGYTDGYLSGRVDRVDYRYGTLFLRDDRSGRIVQVDMRATEHRRGVDFSDLRRGDFVTLAGSWERGAFRAYRIDSVRQY